MKYKEYINNNNKAMILLHEIYGINKHIEEVCQYYLNKGYDVYCPNLLSRDRPFDYSQSEEAYLNFKDTIGFDIFEQINIKAKQLRQSYKKVLLMGFSIGATIAWRCTSSGFYDGMVGYYGSRIRDYISVMPKCPTLLIFAMEDSFDVDSVVEGLRHKEDIRTEVLTGKHGFLDTYSVNYHLNSSEKALMLTAEFLISIG